MKGSNRIIPLALFMFAFSMGMDLHHTMAIEAIEETRQADIPIKPQQTWPDSAQAVPLK